jgi:cardiolipin synthase A/B
MCCAQQMSEPLLICIATALLTSLAILVTLNLTLGERQVGSRLRELYAPCDPRFLRAMNFVLAPPLLAGNKVMELLNGAEIFPAMLRSIRAARSTITLETFIYWSGSIGEEFSEALIGATKRGVEVKLLLDWFGGDLDKAHLSSVLRAGVDVRRYNPPRWFNLSSLNNRTHRRLMVVDGQLGFIGGVGIADVWCGHAQDRNHWRDTHFQVEGPVVSQLQGAFVDNWLQTTGDVLHGDMYFPPLEAAGCSMAQLFTSAPRGGAKSMQLLYLMSIAAARESIEISASYFLPNAIATGALIAAARRGVRVRILVPGQYIDKKIVRRASRAAWGEMLAAGIGIFEYQPTMFHCKVLVVDRLWVSLGSTNFDSRSFTINDEANLNVCDREFASRQTAVFEDDLMRSRQLTQEEWLRRGWRDKARDWAASLLRSQL